jgi:hypothetical protein
MNVIITNGRRAGRTTAAMLAAPQGAFYIWPNGELVYPMKLARELGREDLKIKSPEWLRADRLAGQRKPIALDHATQLSAEVFEFVKDYNALCTPRTPQDPGQHGETK